MNELSAAVRADAQPERTARGNGSDLPYQSWQQSGSLRRVASKSISSSLTDGGFRSLLQRTLLWSRTRLSQCWGPRVAVNRPSCAFYQGKPDQDRHHQHPQPQGTLNDNAGPYKGMKRDAAAEKVVEDLTTGLFLKEEPAKTRSATATAARRPSSHTSATSGS